MLSQLGSEFRQGAEDPPLWQNEDRSEELSQYYGLRERDQYWPSIGPSDDPNPGQVVFPDDSWAVDPGVIDQTKLSASSQKV